LQRLNGDGWQQEEYLDLDVSQRPLELATDPNGQPITITIETRTGVIAARVWRLPVGRNTLLLLDSNLPGNRREDQELTARLYGGDSRVRIRQELLLGVGGVRALKALDIHPGVIHLNEGHSASATLEAIRQRMLSEGVSFDQARRRVTGQVIFTTHTPVPAGHDRFSAELIEEHLGPVRETLGLSAEALMGLGRVAPGNGGEPFCMTVLALKLAQRANAVSTVHGQVSRRMWAGLWPGRTDEEVPIGHVTKGVHVHSWLAPQMQDLYDQYLGADWKRRSGEADVWERMQQVDDSALWETHQVLKARLLDFVRRRGAAQCEHRWEPPAAVTRARQALRLDVLTIGFARRFAAYKLATLLLQDRARLARLINDPQRPIQIVFAGKAHPNDRLGKEILREICGLTRDPQFAGKVVFLENYGINIGRHLVQGVDVWVNSPRRPLEASGTSGMKVVLNGSLNLSVLDGWWAEAYDGSNGFAIGRGEVHACPEVQDQHDAADLYDVLETSVIPLYYERDAEGLPRGWTARMKRAIRTLGWRFNADRMVMDYSRGCYLPAAGGLSCALNSRALE
jgi:starch phosphorylase